MKRMKTMPSQFQVYANIFAPVALIFLALGMLWVAGELPAMEYDERMLHTVATATFLTLLRLFVAYTGALVVAIPLALWARQSPRAQRILLPIYDIVQSIPVLVFFPLFILLFIKTGFVEGAALVIISLSMLWHIVFTLISGLSIIPRDILDVGRVFKASRLDYLSEVLIPATMPSLVTGSLLAWAAGWNIIVVAEVLHTYIPGGTSADDLLGVGNLIVQSSAVGDSALFMYSLIAIMGSVTILNFFVWQPLLLYAEKFKFEG